MKQANRENTMTKAKLKQLDADGLMVEAVRERNDYCKISICHGELEIIEKSQALALADALTRMAEELWPVDAANASRNGVRINPLDPL